jgi:hypothetical protein
MCGVCVVKSDESLPTVTGVGAAITSATSRAAGKRGGNLGFVETRSASQVKVGISGFSDAHGLAWRSRMAGDYSNWCEKRHSDQDYDWQTRQE